MALTVEEIRKDYGTGDYERDRNQTTPMEIQRFDDIVYGTDPRWQVLDIYRPKKEDGKKLPVIVSVHGGAWVYGTKETYQYYGMSLAKRGFAVVNFTYRLAPENKFPSALEDTNLVFQWMKDNGEQYGLDLERVFAVGDSAGAHLLTLFSNMCLNPEYAKHFSFSPVKEIHLQAVALNCGVYELNLKEDDDLMRILRQEVMPQGGTAEEELLMNPLPFMTKQFPPVYVMTSNEDFLKDQAPLVVQRLEELEVPYRYHVYGDEHTLLYHVFHCNINLEAASQCNDDECEFFKEYL